MPEEKFPASHNLLVSYLKMTLRDFIPKFVVNQWDNWAKKIEEGLVYLTPPYISRHNSFFSPLVALVALITAIVLFGVAIGSFVTLFTSLLVLYFILTKVFGIRLDMGDVVSV